MIITVIDTDSLRSKVYEVDLLPKNKRRERAVELAVEFAKEVSPEYTGTLAFSQYADTNKMTIVSFERVK